jgi:broad specificity phosphatase PhoE
MHAIAMPVIEHRRHSWRSPTGKHLTQQGVDLARRVGETMGKFDIVITSDLPRAYETAIAMGYAVDSQAKLLSDMGKGVVDDVNWELGVQEFVRASGESKATAKACRKQAKLLRDIAAALPPEGRALVVSHGGVIELGVVGLLPEYDYSAWGPACERCEGVRMHFDGDVCVSAEILRVS